MLKNRIAALVRDTAIIFRVLRHPRTPIAARMTAALVAGYIFSPVQFIPTLIPLVGQLDDAVVIAAGTFMVRWLVDSQLFLECSEGR